MVHKGGKCTRGGQDVDHTCKGGLGWAGKGTGWARARHNCQQSRQLVLESRRWCRGWQLHGVAASRSSRSADGLCGGACRHGANGLCANGRCGVAQPPHPCRLLSLHGGGVVGLVRGVQQPRGRQRRGGVGHAAAAQQRLGKHGSVASVVVHNLGKGAGKGSRQGEGRTDVSSRNTKEARPSQATHFKGCRPQIPPLWPAPAPAPRCTASGGLQVSSK